MDGPVEIPVLSYIMKEWLSGILLASTLFIAPIEGQMIAAGFMIFVSLFTNLWRIAKTKETIVSILVSESLLFSKKLIHYQLLIVTGLVMQQFLIPIIPVVSLVTSVIAAREGLIIFENVSVITGTNFVSALLEKLNVLKKDDTK